jgi:hypothetical protein
VYNEQQAAEEIVAAVENGALAAIEAEKRATQERQHVIAAQLATFISEAIAVNLFDGNSFMIDPANHGTPVSAWFNGSACVVMWSDGYVFHLHGYEAKADRYTVEGMIRSTAERNGHALSKFSYSGVEGIGRVARCVTCKKIVAYDDENPMDISGDFLNKPCEDFNASRVW